MILHDSNVVFRPASPFPSAPSAGEVHLWMIPLTSATTAEQAALSNDEWARAMRFVFTRDRDRFVASRTRLRSVLGAYLSEAPRRLVFERGPHGKPALGGTHAFLRFNLSHAEESMLLAVTPGREVGVDLEALRENVHHEMLAAHYFAPEDQWALRITPEPDRARKFFELWTATEARLKALGLGLNENPTTFAGTELTTRSFTPGPGLAGSVAVEGRDFDLASWQWPS